MKPFRYWLRLLGTFILRFKLFIGIGLVGGVLAFLFIGFVFPLVFSGGTKEIIGITGRHHPSELPRPILEKIGQGLTGFDETGRVVPGLAARWEEEDGKIWNFYLDGSQWHDGTKVQSHDIKYNFEGVEVSYPDALTVRFTLETPFAPFPSAVSRPVFKSGLLGTGEWEVSSIELTSSGFVETLELINFKKEREVIKFFPTEERTKLAFKLGQVDRIIELLSPEPFDRWNTVSITQSINKDRYVGIFFNNESEFFSGKNLRQALSYSIDKDLFGQRALGPISPNSWSYNPQVKPYEYDMERAGSLFEEIPAEMRENLHIVLKTVQVLLPQAERVAQQWRELGIEVTVSAQAGIPTEFDAFMAIFDIPKDPDQYSMWHSSQEITNIANYSNPRIDKLLEDGRLELDFEKRKKIYLDFQRFLLEDAPAVFMYHPVSYDIARR